MIIVQGKCVSTTLSTKDSNNKSKRDAFVFNRYIDYVAKFAETENMRPIINFSGFEILKFSIVLGLC